MIGGQSMNELSSDSIFKNEDNKENSLIAAMPAGEGKKFTITREMINVLLNDPNAEVGNIDPNI
jgi:hypothetical protein